MRCFPFLDCLWVTLRHPSLSLSHQTVWSLTHRSCSIWPSATSVCLKDLWANQGRQWTHPGAVAPRSFVECCLGSQGTLSLTAWDCPEATVQRGGVLGSSWRRGAGQGLRWCHPAPRWSLWPELWMTAVFILSASSRCWRRFPKYAKNFSLVEAGFWAKVSYPGVKKYLT